MSASSLPVCNICGCSDFGTGPSGRLSENGALPGCLKCGSLERQRALRTLYDRLPIRFLSWRRALQFSPDVAVSERWFRSLEVSNYEGDSSLDLQAIDRPDASYDFITLSHVLEFVPDDRAAVSELIRIMSPLGLLHMTLSRPLSRPLSQDFMSSVATTGEHRYFHLYGRDFAERFQLRERGVHMKVVMVTDPVTNVSEAIHFLARSTEVLRGMTLIIDKMTDLPPELF